MFTLLYRAHEKRFCRERRREFATFNRTGSPVSPVSNLCIHEVKTR